MKSPARSRKGGLYPALMSSTILRFLISLLLPSLALAQNGRAQKPTPPSPAAPAKAPAHELVSTDEMIDEAAEQKIIEKRPYRLQGGSGEGKIVDAAGQAVLESDSQVHIYGGTVSPSGKSVLVYYGNSDFDIVNPVTKERFRLPTEPPGKNKFGFGAFHWIDDQTLLGESGDATLGRDGQPIRDDDNGARTRLYLYHLDSRSLEELKLPAPPGVKHILVSAVSSKGLVHLLHDDSAAKGPPDLGWFKVRVKKAPPPK